MREILTRLGPAFIKVGQALAARPDLLPPDYIAELELLQDRIPPFDDATARALIEEELGAPASQVFSRISAAPIAAASLGQVYRATLAVDPKRAARGEAASAVVLDGPDAVTNGAPPLPGAPAAGPAARALLSSLPPDTPVEVAVKVQRPGVRETIALDVFVLRAAAALLRRAGGLNTDLPALVDEWSASLFGELDYRGEERNGTLFKSLYGRLDGVYVPAMVPSLCRRRVLVMEWVEGGRLRSASGSALAQERRMEEGGGSSSSAAAAAAAPAASSAFSISSSTASAFSSSALSRASAFGSSSPSAALSAEDELRLVDVGVRCSLEQMMSVGFFHADPHQGNFIRRASDGRLAYIDFGMCARIDGATRRALLTASVHLASREFGSLADDMLALGFFPPGTQRSVVAPALTGVFERAMEGGVQALSFQELSADLGRTMYAYKFRLPTYATLLVRSLTVLEGIARSADREYPGLLQSAYPWIARRLLQSPSPELRQALRSLLYRGNRFRFDRLESLLLQAARSPPRPAAMVGLAEAPGSAPPPPWGVDPGDSQVTAAGGALGLLLSPDAAFVREILVDELAKGLDSGARVAADGARDAAAAAGRALLGAAAGLLPAGSPPRTLLVDPAVALQAAADRALPRASRGEDREQVDGVLRLAGAMREFSRADAARAEANRVRGGAAAFSSSSSSPASSNSPLSLFDPEDPNSLLASWARAMLPGAAGEAARALVWLAREAAALPPSAAAAAARLPAEVAAKAASRGAARAMRGLAGLGGSPGGGGGGGPSVAFEVAAEDERTRSAAEASSPPSSAAFASSFSSQPARSKPAAAPAARAAPPRPRPATAAATARPAAVAPPRPAPPPSRPPVVNGASPVAIAPVAAASFISDDPILKNVIMVELEEP